MKHADRKQHVPTMRSLYSLNTKNVQGDVCSEYPNSPHFYKQYEILTRTETTWLGAPWTGRDMKMTAAALTVGNSCVISCSYNSSENVHILSINCIDTDT